MTSIRIHGFFAINVKNTKFSSVWTIAVPQEQSVAVYAFQFSDCQFVLQNTSNHKRYDVNRVTKYWKKRFVRHIIKL